MAVGGTFFSRVISKFQAPRRPSETNGDGVTALDKDAGVYVAPIVPPTAPDAPATAAPADDGRLPTPRVRRAAAVLTPSTTPPRPRPQTNNVEANVPACEVPLRALEQDLITLCNLTGSTLLRVKRPPVAPVGVGPTGRRRIVQPGGAASPAGAETDAPEASAGSGMFSEANAGPLETGMELGQSIEQRARGLLLETNITPAQNERLDRVLQSVLDLICALRAARYAWQICQLLPQEGPAGRVALPRLRRVVAQTVEVSGRVIFVIEGQEGAAGAVAEHYRAFLAVKAETASHFGELREVGTLTQMARRLVRAALLSLTVSAESMAKVAARYSLPLGTASRELVRQQEKYRHLDRGDDLLAPLPRR